MSFELNIPKKWHWIIIWIEFYLEMNKWITVWVECLLVWWKSLFMSILDTFGQFSALFLICQYQEFPVYWIELPLNWISRFFSESNNILNWVKQYWIKYWMNHFLAKFTHWIESGRVSNTPKTAQCVTSSLSEWISIWLFRLCVSHNDTSMHCTALHCKYQYALQIPADIRIYQ